MTTLYDRVNWQAGVTPVSSENLNIMDVGIRAVMPVGAVMEWWLPDAPPGFLALDGATVLRANYPELWNFIDTNDLAGTGKPFGVGDGSTTFVLQDRRERFPRGTPAGASVGEQGGSSTHVHANPSTASGGSHAHSNPNTDSGGSHIHGMPNHSHTVAAHDHGGSTGDTDGVHSHSFSDSFTTGAEGQPSGTAVAGGGLGVAVDDHSHSGSVSGSTSSTGAHGHGIGTQSAAATSSVDPGNTLSGGSHAHSQSDTGSGGSHTHTQGNTASASSLPPYFNTYWIIAT